MHVLFIPAWYPHSSSPNLGGFFKSQLALLARAGWRIGVVTAENRSLRSLTLREFALHHFQTRFYNEDQIATYRQHSWRIIPTLNSLNISWWINQTLHLVDRYIQEQGKPDLLHALVAYPASYAAYLASQQHQLPYVITEHSSGHWQKIWSPAEYHRWIIPSCEAAAGVATVSQALAQTMQPMTSTAVEVIPNFIDTDFFVLPPHPRSSNPFVFLAIGNLVSVKGFDLLLQAFAQRFAARMEYQLQIVGSGDQHTVLKAIAIQLGIQDQVVFRGQLAPTQIRDALWHANALVVSSHYETFSIVLLEALATGLPVVATRCGGPQDVVQDHIGILVEPNNTVMLAEALMKVTTNYYEPEVLRSHVTQYYSVQPVLQKLEIFYNEAMARSISSISSQGFT